MDNPICQGSARPHRYCLRNLWTREENGLLGQERLLIFMVTILKSMVSRRFTSAANLSAKIMQQRSYEVRKICSYRWCCWDCKASNYSKLNMPAMCAWTSTMLAMEEVNYTLGFQLHVLPFCRMQWRNWTHFKLMLKSWLRFGVAGGDLPKTTCQRWGPSQNELGWR